MGVFTLRCAASSFGVTRVIVSPSFALSKPFLFGGGARPGFTPTLPLSSKNSRGPSTCPSVVLVENCEGTQSPFFVFRHLVGTLLSFTCFSSLMYFGTNGCISTF